MQQTRTIGKEIATALAVLAIYLLTVLAPMHQARASQLVFEELGYVTLDSAYTLCMPGDTGDSDVLIAKCPAAGIGKNDLVLPAFDAAFVAIDRVALASPVVPTLPAVVPSAKTPPTGSRGPPVLL